MTVLHLVKWSQYYIGEASGPKHQIHDPKSPSATWSLSASSGRGVNLSSWQRKMAAMPPKARLHFQIFWTNPQLLRLTISPWVCKVRLRKNLFAANFVMSFDTAQKQKRGLFKCLQVSTVRHCGSKVLYNSLHPEISKSSQSNPTMAFCCCCSKNPSFQLCWRNSPLQRRGVKWGPAKDGDHGEDDEGGGRDEDGYPDVVVSVQKITSKHIGSWDDM